MTMETVGGMSAGRALSRAADVFSSWVGWISAGARNVASTLPTFLSRKGIAARVCSGSASFIAVFWTVCESNDMVDSELRVNKKDRTALLAERSSRRTDLECRNQIEADMTQIEYSRQIVCCLVIFL